MDKTLKDILNQSYDNASKSLAAIKSYGEYCETFASKVTRFLESDNNTADRISVVLQDQFDSNISHVGLITAENYNAALEEEESLVEVLISDTGELMSVTGATLIEAVQNNLSEIIVQGEFIRSVFDSTVEKAGDFFTFIRSKYKEISSSIIEKYSSLWDGSNPMMSIKNFLQQRSEISVQHSVDGMIDLYDPRGYAGGSVDIWATAFSSVFDKIGSFFDKVWQGIDDLKGFFERVWNGLVNVFKWLVSKAFSQLFTNYEKAGSHYGLIDVPLLQTYLGRCYYGLEGTIPNEAYNIDYYFKPKYNDSLPDNVSVRRIVFNEYRYLLYDWHSANKYSAKFYGHRGWGDINSTTATLYHDNTGYYYKLSKCLSIFNYTFISIDGINRLNKHALALYAIFTYRDIYKGVGNINRDKLPLLKVELVYCAIEINSEGTIISHIPLDEYPNYKAYLLSSKDRLTINQIEYLFMGCYGDQFVTFMDQQFPVTKNNRDQYSSVAAKEIFQLSINNEIVELAGQGSVGIIADLTRYHPLRPVYWEERQCYALNFVHSSRTDSPLHLGFTAYRFGTISNGFNGRIKTDRGVTSPSAPLLISNDQDDHKCFNYDPCWLDTLLAYKHSDAHDLPAPDGRSNGYLIQWNCADNFNFYYDQSDDALLASIGINLRSICNHLIYNLDDEDPGSFIPRTLDIVVPTSTMPQLLSMVGSYSKIPYAPHDCLIRFGLKLVRTVWNGEGKTTSKSFALVMQVFALSSWDDVSSVSDDVNACRLHDTAYALAAYMADNYHCIPFTHFHVRFDNAFTIQNACSDFADEAVDVSSIDRDADPTTATFDLVSNMHLIDTISYGNGHVTNSRWTRNESSSYAGGNLYACLILAILAYSALQGPGYLDDFNDKIFDDGIKIYKYKNQYISIPEDKIIPLANLSRTSESEGLFFTWNEYTVSTAYGEYITTQMSSEEAILALKTNLATFTPYLMYSPYNVSVHYQSNIERSQEAEQIIWAVVIAVIGVTVALTARHFIKKRRIRLELAQGHMESLSWTAGDNPTKENIKAYSKARKKYKRISKFNSLLGIGDYDPSSALNYTTIEGVIDQVTSMRGYNSQDKAPTLQDVYSKITGLE